MKLLSLLSECGIWKSRSILIVFKKYALSRVVQDSVGRKWVKIGNIKYNDWIRPYMLQYCSFTESLTKFKIKAIFKFANTGLVSCLQFFCRACRSFDKIKTSARLQNSDQTRPDSTSPGQVCSFVYQLGTVHICPDLLVTCSDLYLAKEHN